MSSEQEQHEKTNKRKFGYGLFRTNSKNRVSPSPVTSPNTSTSPLPGGKNSIFTFTQPIACATTAGAGGVRLVSKRSNSVTEYIEAMKEEHEKNVDYDEQNAMLEQMRKEQAEDSQFSLNPLVCGQNDSESCFE